MCRKILILTFLALSPFFVSGNAAFNNGPNHEAFLAPPDCDLAAPTNFQILSIGSTWVLVAWNPTALGVDHHARIYRSSDGALIETKLINATMPSSARFNNLVPGETYFCKINAICPDGTDSKYVLTSADFDIIITELIVAGITPQDGGQTCSINALDQYCNFYADGTTNVFKVRRNDGVVVKQFNVKKSANSHIGVQVNLNNAPLEFKVDDKQGNPNFPVEGRFFQVYQGSTLGASFELYTVSNTTGRLRWAGGNGDYTIQRITAGPSGLAGDPSGGKNPELDYNSAASQNRDIQDQTSTELGMVMISPNPFTDNLDVYLPQNAAEQVKLQLFNLSGQMILDQQYTGGQEQYSLSTANLSPGFYMLRIEVDGKVQTLKVVKSE